MTNLKLYSVKQACDMLGVGRTKFYELANSGELTLLKIGRATRVPATALEDFVSNLKRAA